MKIAFDAKRAFYNKSGLGNYSRDIISGLHEFYPQNSYYLFSPKVNNDLLEKQFCANVITSKHKSSLLGAYWRSVKMGKDIAELNPDIYHGLSNELPKNIAKTSAKKVVTIHDLIFVKLPHLYKFIDRKIYYKKFYFACKNSDKIIATSNQTKNDIIEEFKIDPQKIEVIYQSCGKGFSRKYSDEEFSRIKNKYKLPSSFILSVGSIEERKNVLKVVQGLYYEKIDIDYVIIGRKTKYLDKVLAWAKEHGVLHKLYVLNNVCSVDLPIIYQLSDIFLYPSVYEGFGIPIIEAFNSGLPVITSNIGACAEIAGDAAITVNVSEPLEIGKAIKQIFEDTELKQDLIGKARLRAKEFSRENMITKLYNFYFSL